MRSPVSRAAALAALLALTACADRPTPLDPVQQSPALAPGYAVPAGSAEAARHQRLARRLALALADAGFRAAVHRAFEESAEREGKVYLQRFLGGAGSPGRARLAALAGEAEAAVAADLEASSPIEIYLPVPAHRRAWRGSADLLVATAESDEEAPVAFDPRGRRLLLDPARPPERAVIALGRAELDFSAAGVSFSTCFTACEEEPTSGGTGGTGSTLPSITSPGLYLTYASFSGTFEGWLKGSPEFEVHMLGQDGNSAALKSYQCAGAEAGQPYQYDQNEKQWAGSVMLFSQAQLDGYKAAHPGHSVRVFLIEDDDGACLIKVDSARVDNLFKHLKAVYGEYTGGKDEQLISIKSFTRALSLLNLLRATWSFLTTQDDVVGTAIEDAVAREYFPGANWIVKGDNSITNGAIRLEMK